MNKPPAFQFYAKDFISDLNVTVMTLEERGAYITLLCHLWIEGWLPNGSTKLERLCGNPENWNEIWSNIKHCFYKNGNKLYHKRLEKEKEKQKLWREKSREGGIKSGKMRRGKKSPKGASTTLQPPCEPNTNSSSSSSSSSNKNIYTSDFETFWNEYPRKVGKPKACRNWNRLTKIEKAEALIAVVNYAKKVRAEGVEIRFIKHPEGFLNKANQIWKDHLQILDESGRIQKTQAEIDKEIFKQGR